MTKTKTTTCIVGGGNSAHVLIPFLAEAGHRVHLLTRRPDDWSETVVCQIQQGETVVQTHQGIISCKSSRPIDVIPQADVIVLCLPVHQYRKVLQRIAPHVNRNKAHVYIGAIYGQGGFHWMVQHDLINAQNLSNVVAFAVGSIPWICRALEYGKIGINYGGKTVNTVAVSPVECFKKLTEIFLNDISLRPLQIGRFEQVCSFLSLTMSVDNQILHPARCYGLWKRYGGVWDTTEDIPYFYRDFDELSANIVAKLDADYELVRQAIRKRFQHLPFNFMLSYLELEHLNYNDTIDILSTLRDSTQLGEIKTPTVEGPDGRLYLDKTCRFFEDDIPYGLLIAKSIAEMFYVETPFITEVIEWAQKLRGEEFIVDGSINREYCLGENAVCGIPQVYGIDTIGDLVE